MVNSDDKPSENTLIKNVWTQYKNKEVTAGHQRIRLQMTRTFMVMLSINMSKLYCHPFMATRAQPIYIGVVSIRRPA